MSKYSIQSVETPKGPIVPFQNSAVAVRPAKKRKSRNLPNALYYRPRDIWELFGIPSSTLCELCKHQDPERRIPSLLIKGKSGRKGMRLINRTAFDAWLNRQAAA